MIYVQFSDSTHSEIVSVFAGPQDPAVYANLGTVSANDDRLTEFMAKFSR